MRSILYGNDWEQRATKLPSIGIMIAPEIFRVTERIYFQNGKAVMEGTQYFDWETAHQLVENHNVPAGWRMMKPAEARKIEEFYNACQSGKLVLGHDGYVVPPNMVAYKYCPAGFNHYVVRRGITGCYWLDEHMPSSTSASLIEVSGLRINITECYMDYGLPLLLVKDL